MAGVTTVAFVATAWISVTTAAKAVKSVPISVPIAAAIAPNVTVMPVVSNVACVWIVR